jgi:uncharacterized membrane protein YuzA (DUF378 family)
VFQYTIKGDRVKLRFKIFYLLIIGFCYLFSKNFLTRFLYPLENKYGLCWGPNKEYNIIDCNIPHVIVFIGVGMLFRWWGLVFVFLLEVVQAIMGRDLSRIDIKLNTIGLLIGIFITWCYGKIKKERVKNK